MLTNKPLRAALLTGLMFITTSIWASAGLESLKGVSVPSDSQLTEYVKDHDELVALGKALFWDEQAGVNDQACATCHFHAGADSRSKNQLSPHGASGSSYFGPTRTGGGGANYLLKSEDWPLFELYDKSDRNSGVAFDTDDVVSSQGVLNAVQDNFEGDITGEDFECSEVDDPFFNVRGINTRRVEPRNAPSVFNTGFMFRLFWDGRANNRFNGVDPFGKRNENARVLRNTGGSYHPEKIDLKNAALASLSVGPPVSTFEMNCVGRKFSHIGRKLLNRPPLGNQQVHIEDSVLGSYANDGGQGLTVSYGELIQNAFKNEWWNGSVDIDGFSHMETNFSFYWGLALQAYQASLVSDDAPLDRYLDGESNHGMNNAAIRGMGVFLSDGKCIACHKGPDFTAAGHVLQSENEEGGLVERMTMGSLPGTNDSSESSDKYDALYDNGFYNIGVAPTSEDIGLGGLDRWGNPLSFTRQEKNRAEHYKDVLSDNAEWCANEGHTCHVPSGATATIWFGSFEANKWNVLFNQTESKTCRQQPGGWGNPAPGYSKHCRIVINQYSDHIPSSYAAHCAQEGGTCHIPAGNKATVWYGKNGYWTAKTNLSGNVSCNNGFFGDPIGGTVKECRVETTSHENLDVPTADSLHCSNNYSYCNVGTSVPSTVWYGSGNNWTAKHNVTGYLYCKGSTFGVSTDWGAKCRSFKPSNYVGPVETPVPPTHAVHCANEGEHCNIPEDKVVTLWYGADTRWTFRSNAYGTIPCKNYELPDAARGTVKTCKYEVLKTPDPFFVDASKLEVDSGKHVISYERDAVDGSFKTSGLRNVELTGPYFHNGGQLTLRQVVEFYNRGGDRQRVHNNGQTCDTTGLNDNCTNIDPDIEHLGLSDSELDDLVAFLEALTDDRVRTEKAPFDHPSLTVPLGHTGDENDIIIVDTPSGGVAAEDALFVLPAVGRHGRTADGRRPLPRFDQLVSCTDSSGDIASCFDEAYNSTDYVEPPAAVTSVDITYAHTTPNTFLWLTLDWDLHVQGVAEFLPTDKVSIYKGLTNGPNNVGGECDGSLLAHAVVDSSGSFSANITTATAQHDVCVSAYGTRTALGTNAVSQ